MNCIAVFRLTVTYILVMQVKFGIPINDACSSDYRRSSMIGLGSTTKCSHCLPLYNVLAPKSVVDCFASYFVWC